jgi:hypothetical protein
MMLIKAVVCVIKWFCIIRKLRVIRQVKLCESKESYFVGDKVKECEHNAVKIGKKFKSSVNIIVTVADAENHQNYAPKLMISMVTTQKFLKKS